MDIAVARDMALHDLKGDEYDHFGKAAYRVKPKRVGAKPGRTFMTLWIEEGYAVLMLNVEQQTELVAHHPAGFRPHPSKWGIKGATIADLAALGEPVFRSALDMALENALR